MEPDRMSRLRLGRRFLARGESLVATLGLSGSLILCAAMGASWWWTAHTHRATLLGERSRQLEVAAGVAARSIESLLASSDLSGARCIVSDLAQRTGSNECLLLTPNGGVLAASDLSRITLPSIPAEWPAGAATPSPGAGDGALSTEIPIALGPNATGLLSVRTPVNYPIWTDWEIQLGGAAAAVVGLGAFLAIYHRVRTRMRAMGAVGDALRCLQAGEVSREALEISESYGDTARTWNSLLREREATQRQLAVERSGQPGQGSRRRDENLADACDAMWHGLLVVDDQLKIRYANGAAAIFLGTTRESLVGAEARAALPHAPVIEALARVADRALRTRSSVEVEPEPGRDAVLRFSIRPMRKSDTMAAMVLIEDVTQQRIADKSRNGFVAQATHELRTPLTNIRLYVEALLERPDQDAVERAGCLNVINEEVRRLERIVGDMLSVSELEAGSLALACDDVRLDALFQQIQADFLMQAQEKKIRMEYRLPPKLSVIRGDRDKILISIANLVGNALKYTPGGGEVSVSVRENEGMVVVDVADTGIGINEEESELVFEKFYRAKDKRLATIAGSGLGLALARQIARMHGGDITLSSAINKGSTFTLTLPAAAPVSLAA
jgi:PAS domain S-box-containing protein